MILTKLLMNWKADMIMSEYNVIITIKANDDIIDIGDYITYTLLEPDIALNLVKGLRLSISSLKSFPKRYALVDDVVLKSQSTRIFKFPKTPCIFCIIRSKIPCIFCIRSAKTPCKFCI